MTSYGYARVSTRKQDLGLQIQALQVAGVDEIFEDKISGASLKRPQLQALMAKVEPGDEIVVWKLDRFSRSVIDFERTLQDLDERGVRFRSLQDGIDTSQSSPMSKFMRQMLAAFAEFEREVILERILAGLDEAKRQGVRLGRPERCGPKLKDEIVEMGQEGLGSRRIHRRLNDISGGQAPSRATIARILQEAKALEVEVVHHE